MHRLERAKKQSAKAPTKFRRFGETYYGDLVGFVHDCFIWGDDESPAPYQDEILAALVEHFRVSGRGPHGLGKTALESWAMLWFALTRDALEIDWKAPATASVWRQLTKFLFPELHKWARRLNWNVIGRASFHLTYELQTLNLKLNFGEAFAIASDEPSAIEGAHATEILYLFDESKAIPAATFDAAEGAFMNAGPDTKAKAFAMAMSTPGETSGRFYDIHKHRPGYEDWWTRHVTLTEAIAAGRISAAKAAQRRKQWGEKSPIYLNRVLGEFAEAGTDTLIPLSWIEASNERWYALEEKYKGGEALGVDVARFGDDSSVIARRIGTAITSLEDFQQLDTMVITGKTVVAAHGDKQLPIHVDVIGVGAGVVDRLREQEYTVTGVNASEKAVDARGNDLTDSSGELKFLNLRSYLWWMLRERLDPQNDDLLALPPSDLLSGDLTAPKWKVTSAGRIQVESKDEIRKRIGRSTDFADAVALAVVPPGLLGIDEPDWGYGIA